MSDVNWWLMALAFVLGLLLTFAMMIRRVTREVPVTQAVPGEFTAPQVRPADLDADLKADLGRVAAAGTAAARGVGVKLDATARRAGDALDTAAGEVDAKMDSVSGRIAAKFASVEEVPTGPYGKGSATAGDGGSGPAGWLIKGNADSMLFHGPDSPSYGRTIAEVWFFDEAAARAAGFDKWDKNLE